MGITVLPGTPAPTLSSGLPAAADGIAATHSEGIVAMDFAGLLAQQMLGGGPQTSSSSPLNPLKTTPNPGTALSTTARSGKDEPSSDDTNALIPDGLLPPDLASALAMPPAMPTATTTGTGNGAESALQADPVSANQGSAAALTADNRIPAQPLSPKEVSGQTVTSLTPGTDGSANIAATADPSAQPATSFADALVAHAAAAPIRHAEIMPQPPTVETPIGDRGWSKNFSESVVWVTRQDIQSAQLNLNPPHLGPVQITLNMSGDQVTAAFASPHAEVRQAIQDALPQLREMLAGAGINLGQANIGAQLQQQQQQPTFQPSDSARFTGDNAILQGATGEAASVPSLVSRGRGLVDLFA